MKPFAAFDIDGTLIRWQLFHSIVHEHGKHGLLTAGAHERIRDARMQWKRRTSDANFATYEEVLVTEYLASLKGMSSGEYASIVQDIFDEYKDQTFTFTRDLAHDLKAKGYVLLAISGSHHEIVEKLAAHHGFDVAVGASLEQVDGRFSGAIDTPIFDKAAVLSRLIKEHSLTTKGSYAIGDSTSDVPMLALAEHPIAFNPDQKFFAVAQANQWDVVVERKNMTYRLTYKDDTYLLVV